MLAYDSTTFSTSAEYIEDARYGFNKDGDGLPTVKVHSFYAYEEGFPLMYTIHPGNIADTTCLKNATGLLSVYGATSLRLTTDNGYYSESNIGRLLEAKYSFITLVKTSLTWVKAEIDRNLERFSSIEALCGDDLETRCVTVRLQRDFKVIDREEKGVVVASHKTGAKEFYLHIYFNAQRAVDARRAFES